MCVLVYLLYRKFFFLVISSACLRTLPLESWWYKLSLSSLPPSWQLWENSARVLTMVTGRPEIWRTSLSTPSPASSVMRRSTNAKQSANDWYSLSIATRSNHLSLLPRHSDLSPQMGMPPHIMEVWLKTSARHRHRSKPDNWIWRLRRCPSYS